MTFKYPVLCTRPGCTNLAKYKIAARWTDGITEELKTYGLACADCVPAAFRHSLEKQKQCRLASGEILETPGIYQIERGQRDDRLRRLPELEHGLRTAGGSTK